MLNLFDLFFNVLSFLLILAILMYASLSIRHRTKISQNIWPWIVVGFVFLAISSFITVIKEYVPVQANVVELSNQFSLVLAFLLILYALVKTCSFTSMHEEKRQRKIK